MSLDVSSQVGALQFWGEVTGFSEPLEQSGRECRGEGTLLRHISVAIETEH